jgi:hypothetical protein
MNVGNNCNEEVQSNGGFERKTIHATTFVGSCLSILTSEKLREQEAPPKKRSYAMFG